MIAFHKNNGIFFGKWISYCQANNIPYKIVDCYGSDIIDQLKECDALIWQPYQSSPKDTLMAKELLYSLGHTGFKIYPDFKTVWHFDDKVAQKYLLERAGAPLIPSYVFYSGQDAVNWVRNTSFPKVFKLRRGAGSSNVKLVRTKRQAIKLINKAFRQGFRQYDPWGGLKERVRMFFMGKTNLKDIAEGVGRFFLRTNYEKVAGNEKGYVYFQDFIDGCSFDVRITVVKDKCYAFKRLNRKGDFRASGSHTEIYSSDGIPMEMVKIAFQIAGALKMQSAAFDFLITKENKYLITEVSYAFGWDEGDCYGYWDSDLNWYDGDFNPFGYMIENILQGTENTTKKDDR